MPGNQITKTTLEEQLPSILREQARADGLPEHQLPSWDYISANTRYSAQGLHNRCQELYDQTLHEFLRSQGFGVLSADGDLPTTDEEVINSISYVRRSLESRQQWDEGTLEIFDSMINKAYEAIHERDLDVELLELGHYDTLKEEKENIQNTIQIVEYWVENLSDGTVENYLNIFRKYFKISYNKFTINMNPVISAEEEFDLTALEGETVAISADQISELWHALNNLNECPIENYKLAEWRMWMKALIVYLVAVGPRASEVVEPNVVEQLHFGADPRMHFQERKNLRNELAPEKVPIMACDGFLEAYVEYIKKTDQLPKIVPSTESESGSRDPGTLNNWMTILCKIADVRIEEGDDIIYPTLKHFRRFWKTRYKIAVHENRSEIEHVADEGGTDTPRVDENNYIDDQVNRDHLRDLAREHFEDVINIEDLPEPMKEAGIDPNDYLNRSAKLGEFVD